MKLKHSILFLMLTGMACTYAQTTQASSLPKDTISVASFGLKPDTRENAVPYVQKAIEACRKVNNPILVFPTGRYDFWPQHCFERDYYESNLSDIFPKRLAILIEQMNGFTLDGLGSEFVFHDRMQPITIDNSSQITIRNLSIDWDIPLTAQATIEAATDSYIDLRFNACENPYVIEEGKLVFTGEGWKSHWWGIVEFDKATLKNVPQTADVFHGGSSMSRKFMHNQSEGLEWARAGDTIGFIDHITMYTVGTGKVKSFTKIDHQLFDIELEEAAPAVIHPDDGLENLTWTPSSITIANSFFGSSRARGLLVSTPGKVLIENNIFESHGSAILLPGDANSWYSTGGVRDVTIRGNIFRSPCLTFGSYQFCEAVISIFPEIPKADPALPYHRNIRIVDNEFHLFDYPIVYAKSVQGLEFSRNKLIRSYDYEPFHPRKAGLTFEFCSQVKVMNNEQKGDILGTNIHLIQTPKKEVFMDKKSIFKF